MASLSLSIVEIVVLMMGAITLGFTIHFFLSSKSSLKFSPMENEKMSRALEDWKLRYFNDTEVRDKELAQLRQQLNEALENEEIAKIEAEEMSIVSKRLKKEIETLKQPAAASSASNEKAPDYIQQLKQAQSSLVEQHEKISRLLGQIDVVTETEEKQQEIQKLNEELSIEIDLLRSRLKKQEQELDQKEKKEQITSEMTSRLDSAYHEFNALQDKIHRLEMQVTASKKLNMDYEELKETHLRTTQDFEEQKKKYASIQNEHKQALEELTEVEDKLRESNFQRQQLQKRVAYLEELNNDLQDVANANKNLENQLKRIGELESMLNVVSEERDELARKQVRIQ